MGLELNNSFGNLEAEVVTSLTFSFNLTGELVVGVKTVVDGVVIAVVSKLLKSVEVLSPSSLSFGEEAKEAAKQGG